MNYLTGEQAADLLGISRKSLYRWATSGRLPSHFWTVEYIIANRAQLQKRKRGPARNPNSVRYGPRGRHNFYK